MTQGAAFAQQAQATSLEAPSAEPSPDDQRTASDHERKGRDALKKKDYAAAVEAFEKAYRLAGQPSALRGAAEAHASMGKLARAHLLYELAIKRHDSKLKKPDLSKIKDAMTGLQQRTGTLEVKCNQDGANVEVDGVAVGTTPLPESARLDPGAHKLRVTKEGFEPFERDTNTDPGTAATVDVELKEIPKVKVATKPGEVQDFCALKPKGDGKRYVRQRLVIFDLGGEQAAYAEEVEKDDKGNKVGTHKILEEIKAHNHVREVFLTTFPMPRFHNVVSTAFGPESLSRKQQVTDSEFTTAAGDDKFAAYSLGCADWVAVPRIVQQSGVWTKVKKQKDVNGQKVEYLAWDLDLTWSLEIDVYRREGKSWTLAQTVAAQNGGLLGMAMNLAAGALQDDSKGDQPSHISKRPEPECKIPESTSAGSVGLSIAACAGVRLEFNLQGATAPGTGQSRSAYCKDVDDDSAKGKETMMNVARCTSRTQMEKVTLAIQKETKKIEGWKLFAPLQEATAMAGPGAIGISIGREEGAARGDTYVSVVMRDDGTKDETGFARIVRLGVGGTAGIETPSVLKWRAGEEPIGTRMEEHPQIGVILGLQPGVGLLTSRGDLSSSLVYGGTLEGGYNASRFVEVGDEFWSKIYVSYFAGADSTSIITTDLMPEVVMYVGNRLSFFGGIGPSYTNISATLKKEPDPADPAPASDSAKGSGNSYGLAAETGLEFALSPDMSARLTGFYRQNFTKAELKDDDKNVIGNAGTVSGAKASLSVSYIF